MRHAANISACDRRLRGWLLAAPVLLLAAGCIGPELPVETPASVRELLSGAFGTMTEFGEPVITSKRRPVPPFVTLERGPKAEAFQLCPILRWADNERRQRLEVLWPWITWRGRGESWSMWLLPVFHASDVVRDEPGGKKSSDLNWTLFPILWGGSETNQGSYFAVFPVGGTIRKFLFKDEIWFVLFPLYMHTHEAAYDANHILFPFFSWWSGERQHGWRIFPFYGEDVREGKFERRAVMWPLVTWWHFALDSANPGFGWMVFPFAGHIYNDTYDEKTVLAIFNWSYDESRHRTEVHAPWLFFYWAEGDDISSLKLCPFIGTKV